MQSPRFPNTCFDFCCRTAEAAQDKSDRRFRRVSFRAKLVDAADEIGIDSQPLFDLLVRINPASNNRWAFLPGFSQMMGTIPSYTAGVTRPTTLPLFQWSQHAMIPLVVYRHLNVPMMILDPQQPNEVFSVTDQNERLARLNPTLVTHRVYPQTNRDVLRAKPGWFVRDALELLERVRERVSG